MPPEFQKAVIYQRMQEYSAILRHQRPALQESGREGTVFKMPSPLLSYTCPDLSPLTPARCAPLLAAIQTGRVTLLN